MSSGRDRARFLGILVWLLFALPPLAAGAGEDATGETIIRDSLARHEAHGTLCEDLTMVLTGPRGERSVRTAHTLFRRDATGESRLLLVTAAPPELAGVTLKVHRLPTGAVTSTLYFPAFGQELKEERTAAGLFLDTDFTPAELMGEETSAYRYLLGEDARIDRIDYWVVTALPLAEEIAHQTGYGKRLIYVRKDTLFISRIDYLDRHDHLLKRQTRHNLKPAGGSSWRAEMVLMEGIASHHQTLLKRTNTVFADECAPAERFTAAEIFATPQQALGLDPAEGAGDAPPEDSP